MLTTYSHIFFHGVFSSVWPIFTWIITVFLLSYRDSLYILHTYFFYIIWLADIICNCELCTLPIQLFAFVIFFLRNVIYQLLWFFSMKIFAYVRSQSFINIYIFIEGVNLAFIWATNRWAVSDQFLYMVWNNISFFLSTIESQFHQASFVKKFISLFNFLFHFKIN